VDDGTTGRRQMAHWSSLKTELLMFLVLCPPFTSFQQHVTFAADGKETISVSKVDDDKISAFATFESPLSSVDFVTAVHAF
jgi:hypothetical protein